MKKFSVLLVSMIFSLVLIYPQSHELSLKDLCSLSSDIIIAKPVSYFTFQSKDTRHIYTKIKFEVSEKIKGRFDKEDTFEMTVYGGTYNGISKIVIDAPTYMIEEESILFLSENKSKEPLRIFLTVTGGVQGKYNIYVDEKDGLKKVLREQALIQLPNEESNRCAKINPNQQSTLNEILNQIKKEMEE